MLPSVAILPRAALYWASLGFAIHGVLTTPGRVRVLLHRGTPCFRGYGWRNGERRHKSIRGCIASPDLSILNLVIVKKGDNDLSGASKIRKLYNLSKEDDHVRKYVNTFTTKTGKQGSQDSERNKQVYIRRIFVAGVENLGVRRRQSSISWLNVYSNGTKLSEFNNAIFFQGLPGLNYLMLLSSENDPTNSNQGVRQATVCDILHEEADTGEWGSTSRRETTSLQRFTSTCGE
ncbi:hypothetical protein Taro_036469 [Colocasia esculenta]|uniref:Uncharacterized protein n=1 Tax=Colocasia esculenta TaxID=4460 RepID=A0A843W1N2_COLES|nr:hypothetical protein [Colocasia esculenta]